jgi:Icc protein
MAFIVHLSDMHVGAINFKEKYLLSAINRINELDSDLVIITGDLTENGYYDEFKVAAEYIDLIENQLLVVPGNHDARHIGNECFEGIIKKRCKTLKAETDEISAIGLDSSEPDLDYGKIGRSQQASMEMNLEKADEDNLYKIIALHHHIIPVPKTGRERNVLTDAGDILKSVIDGKANIVLSGHKHVPYVWFVENTAFVTAGTVSSLKLRGKDICSFNTINIQADKVEIILNQADGNSRILAKYENKCKVMN